MDVRKLVSEFEFSKLTAADDRYAGLSAAQRARVDGKTGAASPWRRFQQQKARAKERGIAWHLTFAQWWTLWESRWHQRGVGERKYCMCRKEDRGAYEIGNVSIELFSPNARVGWRSRKSWRNGKRKEG